MLVEWLPAEGMQSSRIWANQGGKCWGNRFHASQVGNNSPSLTHSTTGPSLSCTTRSRMLLTLGVSLIWSKGSATETNALPWGKGGQMVPSKEDFASTAEPKG